MRGSPLSPFSLPLASGGTEPLQGAVTVGESKQQKVIYASIKGLTPGVCRQVSLV